MKGVDKEEDDFKFKRKYEKMSHAYVLSVLLTNKAIGHSRSQMTRHIAGALRPTEQKMKLTLRSEVNSELNFPPKLQGARSRLYRRKQASKQDRAVPLVEKEKRRDPGMRVQLKYT